MCDGAGSIPLRKKTITPGGSVKESQPIHPRKFQRPVHQKMRPWKRRFLVKSLSFFRFHVHLLPAICAEHTPSIRKKPSKWKELILIMCWLRAWGNICSRGMLEKSWTGLEFGNSGTVDDFPKSWRSPAAVGSFSHFFTTGFVWHPRSWSPDFWTSNSRYDWKRSDLSWMFFLFSKTKGPKRGGCCFEGWKKVKHLFLHLLAKVLEKNMQIFSQMVVKIMMIFPC